MPSLKNVKFLTGLALLSIITLFLHSCKGDTELVNSNNGNNNPTTTLTVTAPKNGDTMKVASAFEIKWVLTNSTSKVKIEYSSDNGSSWSAITSSLTNTGSYVWDPIPNTVTNQGKIKVSTTDNIFSSQSTGFYSIVKLTSKSLALRKPNGGEVLNIGETFRIEWVSSGVTSVKIEFSSNNGTEWNPVISTYPADSGFYLWNPIPNIASVQCLMRISDVSNDTLKDVSNSTFQITSPRVLRVTSPNGGESWGANSTKTIAWYSSQVANVRLEYTIDNGVTWNLIANDVPSTGVYNWSPIPNTPTVNAKIKISNMVDLFPSDVSDSVFSITAEPALKVLEPNGGENWMSGSSQYIKWTTALGKIGKYKGIPENPYFPESIANIKIEFSTNSGSNWFTIVNTTPNNGSYYWDSVPSHNSSLCLVRISDADHGVPFDLSDAVFTIYNTIQQEIIVTRPNGGEIFPAGTSQNITWTSTGVATVSIDYTINNGSSWTRIVSNLASNGFYSWTQVPNTASTNCKIKISDAADNFPSDQSNAVFTIAPEPDVRVITPNGGEVLQSGQTYNITWTTENIANVKIEFTTNNGANWSLITASTPSDGLYEWENIPNINSNLCRIKISDADDGQPFDISDQNFQVTNLVVQLITVVSPNGGEGWEAGTSHNITWTASGITNVKIEFTTNNGNNWNPIVLSYPNAGSYEWSVPNINSTQCKVRISDASDGAPYDESNASFSVSPIQSLTVIYPNGGEVIVAGTEFNILWASSGIEKVKIEYTINNGIRPEDWYVLVDSIPSTGSFTASFSIPTNQYRIKISDAGDGSPSDQSNGVFTISPQPTRTITVTSPNGGEDWLVGSTNEIRWTSTNIDSVKIEYTLNGGAEWKLITAKVPSNGLYNWNIPTSIQFRSDLCKIKISDAKNLTPSDETDNYFSLHPQIKLLRLLSPNGGEVILLDTDIRWVSAGIDTVRLEYTEDNGQNWNAIIGSYPSTGVYHWHIGPGLPSSLARIRIFDASDSTITDMSDSYFSIRMGGGLKILSPSGNNSENLKAGSSMNITWQGIDKIKEVNISYSADDGKSWNLIDHAANEFRKINSFTWNNIPKGNIKIKVSDNTGKYKSISGTVKIN